MPYNRLIFKALQGEKESACLKELISMRRIYLIVIIACIFFSSCLHAQADTLIEAEVDKISVSLREAFTYKITITSSKRNLPKPILPKLDDFFVISSSQSSQISFGSEEKKSTIGYSFILSAKNKGKFIIGKAELKIGKKSYFTDSFEIEVLESREGNHESFPGRPQISDQPQYIL
jgi:hypothetical protein